MTASPIAKRERKSRISTNTVAQSISMWLVDGLMREQLLVIDDQVEEHQQQRHKTEKKYHSSHVSHHVHATT